MQRGDPELQNGSSKGAPSTIDAVYDQYRNTVYDYLCYLENDRTVVADLFQEVWLRVVRQLDRGAEVRNVRAWLLTIASNLHRDAIRRRSVRRKLFAKEDRQDLPTEHETAASDENPISELIVREFRSDLEHALAHLTPRQRQVFVLKEIEGLKHEEVAKVIGISPGACKSTLHHAVQALRKQLSSYTNSTKLRDG